MHGALALALAVSLVAGRAAAADGDHDAPSGVVPLQYQVPPAKLVAEVPPRGDAPSLPFISSLRRSVRGLPDAKGRDEAAAALETLEREALKQKPEEQQRYVDTHLGEFNQAVRQAPAAPAADESARLTGEELAKAAMELNGRAERWEESREFADKALGYDPNDRDALVGGARASYSLGDMPRSWAEADKAARLAPDSAAAYTARAMASFGLGQYLQAMEDARKALALDPNDKTAFGLLKLAEGRVRPTDIAPGQSELAHQVEREYHGMVQQLSQVEERRLSPASDPRPAAAQRLTSAAGSKLAVKDYWGAIDQADKALALDPQNATARYFRATANGLIGRYGDAVRDATEGLSYSPADHHLLDARAWAYNRIGRLADAIADSNHALEIDPKDAYAHANRGYAHELRGDYEAMARDLKAAATLNPAFDSVYRDAARRHGLSADGLPAKASPARAALPRGRSFMLVLGFSLVGGILIALGLVHVNDAARSARKAPVHSAIAQRYEMGKPIGSGGMGVVYEARDRKLGRSVAVKVLRDESRLDPKAKAAFLEEARMLAELSHPSIVDLHAVEEDESGLYLVFERLGGRPLDEFLAERKRLSVVEAKRVLGQVCDALTYAHGRDVVHRDLKPGNVMMLDDGRVKVMDFGISRHASEAGKAITQSVVGTPHYMAPEQEYGVVRKESDVFSLGACLYELLTGARPYEGGSGPKLAKGYIRATTRVPELPAEVDALIDKALEPDPDRRIPTPAEFRRRLDALPETA
ncbi:MAG: protein kinase [Elusimicrobiota bacterium]|nr:protein kinase [Elusimicrobiota bacterium]